MQPTIITSLEIRDFKRVSAVSLQPSADGLTIIGGNNKQGKTSILDAIAFTLGGEAFRPSQPTREGAEAAETLIVLSNGLEVRRAGKNGSLKVTDPSGVRKSAQTLLDDFVGSFALDLPAFLHASPKDKAAKLLAKYPGLSEKLKSLSKSIDENFQRRTLIGQQHDQKAKYAKELPQHFDVPTEPLSGIEMSRKMQDALLANARNKELRDKVPQLTNDVARQREAVNTLERQLASARTYLSTLESNLSAATAQAEATVDTDTATFQRQLEELDATNAKIRQNLDKQRAEHDAAELQSEYDRLTDLIENARAERVKTLSTIEFPYPGLSFNDVGELTLDGRPWDALSGSQKITVAAAIASSLNPKCGFILLDGLEAYDPQQLADLNLWLSARGLQAIGTRVSTGDECSVIIEDGRVQHTTPGFI